MKKMLEMKELLNTHFLKNFVLLGLINALDGIVLDRLLLPTFVDRLNIKNKNKHTNKRVIQKNPKIYKDKEEEEE